VRKPIVLLNIALLLVAVMLAAGIRATWRRDHARYARLTGGGRGAAISSAAAGGQPARAPGNYSQFVAQNLFSADRNNEQPVVKVEKKPRPPLPYVIGTLNLGSGMAALMADDKQAGEGKFRRVKVGEEVGGFTVVAIFDHTVTVEFDGEKTPIDVYESAAAVPGRGGGSAPYAGGGGASAGGVQTAVTADAGSSSGSGSGTASPSAPSVQIMQPNAPPGSVSVRIEGNYKVYTRPTPWGVQTWKEEIAPPTNPK
jgi:hypothetical protein